MEFRISSFLLSNKVTLDFLRPRKPTDNALFESFNGSFRDECLSTNWFLSVDDAKKRLILGEEIIMNSALIHRLRI